MVQLLFEEEKAMEFALKGSKHKKSFRITLFTKTKHNIRIFGVILFIKLQNDS